MNKPEVITVPESDDGQRLDRWLKKRMPFALAQKLIRKGAVRIDGKKAKPDDRIHSGQEVRLPAFDEKRQKTEQPLSDEEIDLIRSLVVYDDGDLAIINKPHDIASQGGEGVGLHIDRLLKALPDKNGSVPKLVHRLDKETSGLMVTARSAEAVRALGRMFRDHKVKKTYWALTSPAPEQKRGEIEGAIGKGADKGLMALGGPDAKKAVTEFAVIDRAGNEAAFVAFRPLTGRTHQIRVHAAQALQAPIIGDEKYNRETTDFHLDIAERLHLHARGLVFRHPVQGKEIDIVSPLPEDLERSWQAFNFHPDTDIDPFAD